MKATGEPARLRPLALLQFLGRAVRKGWFWAGVPLMALSFYSLLVLLSWEPISFVIPASALSYVVGTLGAKYILGEQIRARGGRVSCWYALVWRWLRRADPGNRGNFPPMMNEFP